MKTDTKVCIGVTVAIVVTFLIAAIIFHIDIEAFLVVVGFLFLMGLPTYVWSRRRDNKNRNAVDYELRMGCARRLEILGEIRECLDESIVAFKEWGSHIKNLERDDEAGYYAEVALERQVGMNTGGLSAEYGQDVSCLIEIRRKLREIE